MSVPIAGGGTRYFESFEPGQVFDLGRVLVTEEEIVDFARRYDPQPLHLSAEGGRQAGFGGLIASGWLTVGLVMRRFVDIVLLDTVSLGSPGVDEVHWLNPVRPGDWLSATWTVVEARPSRSRPQMGIVRGRFDAATGPDTPVLRMVGVSLLGRDPAAPAS